MGQKVNPHGLRVGVIKGWDSRWFAKDELVGDLLVEDYNIRKHLKSTLYAAGVPKIEIERTNANVRIIIHCAKPGMIVGKGGADIQKLEEDLSAKIGKPVKVSIIEVRNPDLNAQLVAENIASQLERRISFRRAMKQTMARAMRLGARGIKTAVSGRLGGAEIARTEHYHEGTIPLQTLRADIDYGFAEANTTYGKIGVKVWLYNGEVLTGGPRQGQVDGPKRRDDRRDRRNQGDRRQGGYNNNRSGGQGGERRPYNNNNNRGANGGQGGNRPYNNRPNNGPRPSTPKPEGGAQ